MCTSTALWIVDHRLDWTGLDVNRGMALGSTTAALLSGSHCLRCCHTGGSVVAGGGGYCQPGIGTPLSAIFQPIALKP